MHKSWSAWWVKCNILCLVCLCFKMSLVQRGQHRGTTHYFLRSGKLWLGVGTFFFTINRKPSLVRFRFLHPWSSVFGIVIGFRCIPNRNTRNWTAKLYLFWNLTLWLCELNYIDVTTLEGNKYCITGSSNFFYGNSSKGSIFDSKPTKQGLEASTLIGLLQKISTKFKKGLLLI